MSRKVAPPTPKPKSWVHNYTSRARKPEIPYTIRLTPTRPSTVKPDNLPSQPMRDIYKVKPESIFASSPHLVLELSPGQIDNTRPKPQTFSRSIPIGSYTTSRVRPGHRWNSLSPPHHGTSLGRGCESRNRDLHRSN
jgi:hypothetical protein